MAVGALKGAEDPDSLTKVEFRAPSVGYDAAAAEPPTSTPQVSETHEE